MPPSRTTTFFCFVIFSTTYLLLHMSFSLLGFSSLFLTISPVAASGHGGSATSGGRSLQDVGLVADLQQFPLARRNSPFCLRSGTCLTNKLSPDTVGLSRSLFYPVSTMARVILFTFFGWVSLYSGAVALTNFYYLREWMISAWILVYCCLAFESRRDSIDVKYLSVTGDSPSSILDVVMTMCCDMVLSIQSQFISTTSVSLEQRISKPHHRRPQFSSPLFNSGGALMMGNTFRNPKFDYTYSLMGLLHGLYIFILVWVFVWICFLNPRKFFVLIGLHCFKLYWVLELAIGTLITLDVVVDNAKSRFFMIRSHPLLMVLKFNNILTSLLIIRFFVRESLFSTPLFKRTIFSGRVIPDHRLNSLFEMFQTACKRTSVGILKAVPPWSSFGKCAITCINHLDPIEEIISMRFEKLSLCFSLCIVMLFTFLLSILWFEDATKMYCDFVTDFY